MNRVLITSITAGRIKIEIIDRDRTRKRKTIKKRGGKKEKRRRKANQRRGEKKDSRGGKESERRRKEKAGRGEKEKRPGFVLF